MASSGLEGLSRLLQGLSRFFQGLSGRLLVVTVLFVIGFEIFSLIPSLAAYQENWLTERMRYAEAAAQAIEELPQKTVSSEGSVKFLKLAKARLLLIHTRGQTDVILRDPGLSAAPDAIDLQASRQRLSIQLDYLLGPWQTLMGDKDRQIRIAGHPSVPVGDRLAIVVPASPLKASLKTYLFASLGTTMLVSLIFGAMLFFMLSFFIVRPIRRLTGAVARFKANPEDVHSAPKLSGRRDEIGQIEVELADMQEEVRHALRSRARLAALGQAVSKINHDLRNMLTAAQMASERLAASPDPAVAKALPRLERALDRALSLAQNVLAYGKSDEVPARIQIVRLREMAFAAAEDAGLITQTTRRTGPNQARFVYRADRSFFLEADPDHLHRLLVNLMRNALQAIEAQPNRKLAGRVTLTATKAEGCAILRVSDNGPGIPERLREKLFQPFSASNTAGGSGLGLAIARELAHTHGGEVRLVDTGPDGTQFEVRFPLG